MGLFDFLMSDEKKIQKHHRRLTDRDAQPEDREGSAFWLRDNGTPQAYLSLLSRFDMKLDHQMKDAGEKDQVFALCAAIGKPLVEPLEQWLKQCKNIAQPLSLLREVAGPERQLQMVLDLLGIERDKDDFKIGKKRALLVFLADERVQDPRVVPLAAHFLNDFDETIRYAAAEVLFAQDVDDVRPTLLARLVHEDEDSNRLRGRLAEVFAQRRWTLDEHADVLAQQAPQGYRVSDGRYVSA